jgi:hypothetical protein
MILQNLHTEIQRSSINYYDHRAVMNLLQSLFNRPIIKTSYCVFENLCQRFPLLAQQLLKSHINELLLSSNQQWNYRNELFFILFLSLVIECRGFLRIYVPELLNILKNDSEFTRLRAFIPYSVSDNTDDIFQNILLRRIDEFGSPYEILTLFESYSQRYSNDIVGMKTGLMLQSVVAQLQKDSIMMLISRTKDVEHNVEMKSIAALKMLSNHQQQIMDKVLAVCRNGSFEQHGNVWLYLLEIMGLIGAESSSSLIATEILFNYSFSENVGIAELYFHLFSTFSNNLFGFDQMVLEKVFWEISTFDQTKLSKGTQIRTIIENLIVWVDYLKLREDTDYVYKNYLFRLIVLNWPLIFPLLFHKLDNRTTVKQLDIIRMYHTVLDALHESETKLPKQTSIQFANALISLYFFLLESTIVTPSTKYTEGLHTVAELPSSFSHPESDPASVLYYHYFCRLYNQVEQDSIEVFKRELTLVIGKLLENHSAVAESVFDFILDLLFAHQTESRLNSQKVVMPKHIFEQCNFPLQEYNSMLDLLNNYLPKIQRQQQHYYQPVLLSNTEISSEDREAILQDILPQHKSDSETPISATTATTKRKTSLLNDLQALFNPNEANASKNNVPAFRTNGVVIVNPKKVQLHLRSKKNLALTVQPGSVKHSEQIIQKNEQYVLLLISICLQKRTGTTACLAAQLLRRLQLFYPVTTYEQYCKSLPKKPMFERDIFVAKMFLKFPILYSVLDLIAENGPEQLLRFDTTIDSLMANIIGEWNMVIPQTNQLASEQKVLLKRTLQIMSILKKGQWLKDPLVHISDLLPYISPQSVVQVLLSVFHCVHKFKPTADEYNPNGIRQWPVSLDMDSDDLTPDTHEYMLSVKNAMRKHVTTVPHVLFSLFFSPLE